MSVNNILLLRIQYCQWWWCDSSIHKYELTMRRVDRAIMADAHAPVTGHLVSWGTALRCWTPCVSSLLNTEYYIIFYFQSIQETFQYDRGLAQNSLPV